MLLLESKTQNSRQVSTIFSLFSRKWLFLWNFTSTIAATHCSIWLSLISSQTQQDYKRRPIKCLFSVFKKIYFFFFFFFFSPLNERKEECNWSDESRVREWDVEELEVGRWKRKQRKSNFNIFLIMLFYLIIIILLL